MSIGTANIEPIGGGKDSGKIRKKTKYQEGEASIIIVDRSITGLFETRTKVL